MRSSLIAAVLDGTRSRWLSGVVLLVAGCRASPGQSSAADDAAARKPTAGSAAAGSLPTIGAASAIVEPPFIPTRREGPVAVDPTPACTAEPRRPDGANAWLADPVINDRIHSLNDELGKVEGWLGIYSDDDLKAAVVVMHTTFSGYDALRERLTPIMPPLEVVLRPACHTKQRLEEAERVLHDRSWHPRANDVGVAGGLDASFSGFIVTVDESAPEVAAALERRLGSVVRVRLGKPRRN